MRCSATSTSSERRYARRGSALHGRDRPRRQLLLLPPAKGPRPSATAAVGRIACRRSRRACNCCRRPTRTTLSARSPSNAAIGRPRSSTTRARQAHRAKRARLRRTATVRLDLPGNPGKYIQVRGGLDSSGQLIVEVANPTRVAVADVVVAVRYADAQGAIREAHATHRSAAAGPSVRASRRGSARSHQRSNFRLE